MNNNNNAHVNTIKPELVDIFMKLSTSETKGPSLKKKEKTNAQQKLAARRAIEQHFEKKRLERDIENYWLDD